MPFCRRTAPAEAVTCQGTVPTVGARQGHPRRHRELLGGLRHQGFTLELLFCCCSLEQDTFSSHKQSHKSWRKQASRGEKVKLG